MPDEGVGGQTRQDYTTTSITVIGVPSRAAPNGGKLLVMVVNCCIKGWLTWTTKLGHQNNDEAEMRLSSKKR